MRIPSGSTDRYIYFVAVDATDFATRETGLSSFTVYRSRNGAAAAAMTTPTINETDTTNMPGVYELLVDEDTTMGADSESEEMSFHITHAGMAPVTRTVELYRPDLISRYHGPRGPGVYLNDAAANTDTVYGVDGTVTNPVSTIAAAKTIADAQSLDRIYLVNDSSITLAATMTDYEFVGVGELLGNVVDLGAQDVARSSFYNLAIQGDGTGATARIYAENCALQDPGAGTTTLNIYARNCGIVDDITLDTSADNVFENCFSLVAGTSAPIVRASGVAGTMNFRHWSGGLDFRSLSASHNVSVEGIGNIIFDASCNVNATVAIRGLFTKTDNTAGMLALSEDARIDLPGINAEADTAISDAALATAAALATVDTNVDAVLVDTGTTLPATLATIDSNVDAILVDTGTTIPGTLTTIDTVVDGIQADLDNGTDGLGAIKTAVDAVPTATANADALLNRDMSAVSDTTARSPLNALRFLRNKWSVSGSTLTVTKEDDTTSAWTATVTTDATADPITGNDPA